MCFFERYRDIFGKPNEGAHSYRLFGLAIVDVLLTALGIMLISRYTTMSVLNITIITIISVILIHRLFCVNTAVNKLIFGVV